MARTPGRFLSVKNWAEFQHYHQDRRAQSPPWIKFYSRLLEDFTFLALDERQQAQLMKIWLLASRTRNRIPYNRAFVASRIGSRSRFDLDLFVRLGFLIEVEAEAAPEPTADAIGDASKVASKPASTMLEPVEGEGEEEAEETKNKPLSPTAARRRGADTWLTPIANAHEAVFGAGSFAPAAGRFARVWRGLVEAHGAEKCAAHYAHAMRDEARRPFNTPEYVASHFADFDPGKPWDVNGDGGDPFFDAEGQWLAASALAWEKRNGDGTFPVDQATRELKPVRVAGHDPEKIARYLGFYLDMRGDENGHEKPPEKRGFGSWTPNLRSFAITFGKWNPEAAG